MIRKYSFSSNNQVKDLIIDDYYLWIDFKGEDGTSILSKNSAFNPNLVYYDYDVDADDINKLFQDDTYIFLALDDDSYLGAEIIKDTYWTLSYFSKPIGIIEEAVDIIVDSTYIYFLIPGVISGENAKIVKFNISTLAYVSTIDLTTVYNAKKTDLDNSLQFWVVSESNPPKLTKVLSNGTFTTYTLS